MAPCGTDLVPPTLYRICPNNIWVQRRCVLIFLQALILLPFVICHFACDSFPSFIANASCAGRKRRPIYSVESISAITSHSLFAQCWVLMHAVWSSNRRVHVRHWHMGCPGSVIFCCICGCVF